MSTYPGESFSGLHVMCLMYVGFQRVDPTVDRRMPLEDVYREAVKLYGSRWL